MKRYEVHAIRSERWWALQCPELPGMHSQARTLEEADGMAREAIAMMTDAPENSFDLTIVATQWAAALNAEARTRHQANELRADAERQRILILQEMKDRGISLRDSARILGISHQRVGQLLASEPKPDQVEA